MPATDDPRLKDTRDETPNRTRILIVEDNDDFVRDVETTASHFSDQPIEWSRARGIAEALDLIGADESPLPDVAVVDVGLVDGSGLDFVRRARERNFVFPIVVISQNELDQVRYDGAPLSRPQLMEIGANDFQSKTKISESQRDFLRLVISIATEFDRIFKLVDKPDRQFHASISKQALFDLRVAARLCRSSENTTKLAKTDNGTTTVLETAIFLIEGVASREKLRLDYTLKLSINDRMRAFSTRSRSQIERIPDSSGIPATKFEKIVAELIRAMGNLLGLKSSSS